MTTVKEEKITQSFLNLDEETRKCQTEEFLEDCTTKLYQEKLWELCKCVPFWQNEQVNEFQV